MAAALTLAVGSIGVTYAAGDGNTGDAATPDTPTPAPVATGCDAVVDWATLRDCVEKGSSVMLAGLIVADGDDDVSGETITVKSGSNIVIGVKDGAGDNAAGIVGTKNGDTAVRMRTASVFTVPGSATLTITGGTYKDLSADKQPNGTDAVDGTLVYVNGSGKLHITGGTFSGNSTQSGSGGVLRGDGQSTITFGSTNGGNDSPKFKDNTAINGGVMYSRGTVDVLSGTFDHNIAVGSGSASQGGGALHVKYGSLLTVRGGLFKNNLMTGSGGSNGGGAIYAFDATVRVYGGTFQGNGQDPAPGQQCRDNNSGKCWTSASGGGAIYSSKSALTVQGNVVFEGNYAKARGFNSGGGAIWAQKELWIRNSAVGAGKPRFEGNWASITQPTAETSNSEVPTMLTGPASEIVAGGAGGAVFLNNASSDNMSTKSVAYITGGEYINNASGYLGGGIYTEEHTTTYVGKAVAFDNTAGHFGGGLWFCPSGESSASKGGNIALFENSVKDSLDANNLNDSTPGTSDTMAGDDLAIMSPWYKSPWGIRNNTFQLMDTWFTGRSEKTVDWYWDGTPAKEASGYNDKYLGGSREVSVPVLTQAGSDETKYTPRYENPTVSAANRIDIDETSHAMMVCSYYTSGRNGGKGYDATGIDTTAGCNQYSSSSYGNQGVAFKAVVTDSAAIGKAKNTAQITISGNGARLSGGGFGSDGRVIFDSPYSMEWQKVDADTGQSVTTASTWTLSTANSKLDERSDGEEKSPYMALDLRPSECIDQQDAKNCWNKQISGDDVTWSVDIRDNDKDRDNDIPTDGSGNEIFGSISIDNLAPGTYTLKEKTAPTGYELNTTEYTFTIKPVGEDGKPPTMPTLSPTANTVGNDGRTIGDKKLEGTLAWSKTGVGGNLISGATWSLSGPSGFTSLEVKDYCTVDAACVTQDKTADADDVAGKFALDIRDTGKFPNGTYTLTETAAPEGYWLPVNVAYTVTLGTSDTNSRTVTWGNGVQNLSVANTPAQVSWTKVESGGTTPIGGAEWTLTQVGSIDSRNTITPIDKQKQKSWAVKDCGIDDSDIGCTGSDVDPLQWADSNTSKGEFQLTGLAPGEYTLTEKKAPSGYVMSDKTYGFVIPYTEPDSVKICTVNDQFSTKGCDLSAGYVADNAIPNAKAIAVLPLTGGLGTGWGRLLLGGGFAVAAALAAAVTYEWRRRKAFDV
ncbi:hypothetical protein G1C96_0634 [Bifidobacterium sp. DSM 109958]|uniref:SpaA-like prealbumin fold domain-containing protein n=1 Tax=Bifidobacterium moraviense TaxID=2675323 RepID=A0A7Y0F116_9BIFI|nr:prealbumin-like fold domain-containing protein [Bifidobacterium sp. DSM 109958]NMN00057.1 hypothetical protein [Bifidobacterium sp. DSM 109958]